MIDEVANSVFLLIAAIEAFMISVILPPQHEKVRPTNVCDIGNILTITSTVYIFYLFYNIVLPNNQKDVNHYNHESK